MYVFHFATLLLRSFSRRRTMTKCGSLQGTWVYECLGWNSVCMLNSRCFPLCCQVVPGRELGQLSIIPKPWLFCHLTFPHTYLMLKRPRHMQGWNLLALSLFSVFIVHWSFGVHEAGPDRIYPGGTAWHGLHHSSHSQCGQGEAGCEYYLPWGATPYSLACPGILVETPSFSLIRWLLFPFGEIGIFFLPLWGIVCQVNKL